LGRSLYTTNLKTLSFQKTIRRLASELQPLGYNIGATAVRFILYKLDYSLQGNKKTREGEDHPDRNEQFLSINGQVKRFLQSDQSVILVDTKNRENIGNYSNMGREWCPKGKPIETNMHDFPDKKQGKAIPYGVYDIGRNEGWVNVGISHDTSQFAANSIRRWWTRMGMRRILSFSSLNFAVQVSTCTLTRSVPDNLPVRFFPLTVHVTVPFRPTVAPGGIGIVFQTRSKLPIAVIKVA